MSSLVSLNGMGRIVGASRRGWPSKRLHGANAARSERAVARRQDARLVGGERPPMRAADDAAGAKAGASPRFRRSCWQFQNVQNGAL